MRFGYTIIYVPDLQATVHFYEQAFGLRSKFMDENGQYAEMDTGNVTLAFVSENMAVTHSARIAANRPGGVAPGIEIVLISDSIERDYRHALSFGAEAIKSPTQMPWGQTVAYVRDLNGVLVELCTQI